MARTAHITIAMRETAAWSSRGTGPLFQLGLKCIELGLWLMGFRDYTHEFGLGERPRCDPPPVPVQPRLRGSGRERCRDEPALNFDPDDYPVT